VATALFLMMVPASAASAPVPDVRFFPAPGLYRIQTVTDTAALSPAGKAHARSVVNAATGAAVTQYRGIDGKEGAYATPGVDPGQVCIRPVKASALPQSLQIDGCKAGKGRVVGDSMVASSSCPWGKIETSIRQIDGKTWETTALTSISGTAGVADSAGGLLAMRKMAEKMAKEGTPEQRAEAQEFLAASNGLEGELKKHQTAAVSMTAPPGAVATMQAGATARQEYKTVQRMTRVGDCKG
jgi:hypothetical protein